MTSKSQETGFTLMEMLIVLVIMGIISALFISRVSKKPKVLPPKIIQFFEQERSNSIKSQKTTHIRQYSNKLYSTLSEQSYPLNNENNAQHQFSGYLPYNTLTTFFADGTMTARKFSLTEGPITYVISTSPFSNKIKISAQ